MEITRGKIEDIYLAYLWRGEGKSLVISLFPKSNGLSKFSLAGLLVIWPDHFPFKNRQGLQNTSDSHSTHESYKASELSKQEISAWLETWDISQTFQEGKGRTWPRFSSLFPGRHEKLVALPAFQRSLTLQMDFGTVKWQQVSPENWGLSQRSFIY